jgi:uncharacterized phage infection (PIP) family protein YhgE
MARIADLGVARRLSLLVAAAVVITALVVISGILTGNTLVEHAERLAGLERGKAALNHLDTRQSELKSDAYRAALGQDMRADVTDDVASAIEAARAGDAGKGFAVVASEVKDLAQETARATEDIEARVGAIQSDTSGAVDVISRISEVIAKINEYQTTIASAVEEQTATTQEMSRSIGEVAAGSNRIATHISDVATATGSSVTGVSQAQQTSASVARAAEELRTLVGSFRLS